MLFIPGIIDLIAFLSIFCLKHIFNFTIIALLNVYASIYLAFKLFFNTLSALKEGFYDSIA